MIYLIIHVKLTLIIKCDYRPPTAPQNILKHPKNKKTSINCEYCEMEFSRNSSLSKHAIKCVKRLDSLEKNKLQQQLREKDIMIKKRICN